MSLATPLQVEPVPMSIAESKAMKMYLVYTWPSFFVSVLIVTPDTRDFADFMDATDSRGLRSWLLSLSRLLYFYFYSVIVIM